MELVAGQIHVPRTDSGIQSVKNAAHTIGLLGVDAFTFAVGEETFKPFVADASDHWKHVMQYITTLQ